MHIKVKNTKSIYSVSNYFSCKGVGVNANIMGDTNSIVWSPTHGVSNVNSATTLLDPDSTTTYTVTHIPSGDVIQVTVNVDSISVSSFVLINNGAELVVPQIDPNQMVTWFYNGAVLATGTDTVPMTVSGYYWASITKGYCTIYSDTVKAVITQKVSNSSTQGGGINTQASSSSFLFSMLANANTLEDLELIFPDNAGGKTNATVTVNLKQAGTLVKSVSAVQTHDFLWMASGFNTLLQPGMLYEVEVVTDFSSTVLFEPDNLPFDEENGILRVTTGSYIENGNQITGAYPYANFVFTSPIGIDEYKLGFEVYPNPVKGELKIEIQGAGTIEIYNVQGEKVLFKEIEGSDKLDMSALAKGVYLYKISTGSAVDTGKLMKE
jgi:hypothetical protein